MKGHIQQRSKDTWRIIYDAPAGADGSRSQRSVTVHGPKREAQVKLRAILSSLDRGDYVTPTRETVGGFLERWLRDYVRPNLAPTTAQGYEHIISRHLVPALGSVPLPSLTAQQVQEYYAAKLGGGQLNGNGGLSSRTVRHHHRTLHDALQYAVKWGLVARNVAQAVDPPRFMARDIRTLEQQAVPQFLEAAKRTPYYPLLHLALFTGMRRSELLGIRWRDVNLDMLTVSVVQVMHRLRDGRVAFREPKSQKSRRLIDLPPSAGMVLRQWREQAEAQAGMLGTEVGPDHLVFTQPDGRPLLPDSVTHAFTKLARRSGFHGLRLHDLRHSHASLMLQQGIHPKIVQERLGHSSIQLTLDTYSHVVPGLQRAAAMRFEEGLARSPTAPVTEAAGSLA